MSTPNYPAFFTAPGQPSFSTAVAVAGYELDFPFGESRPDTLVITQRFWQLRADYSRPAPNALNCPAYPTARFCDDYGFRDVGMGIVEWTREWATVPGPREEYEAYAFRFPGYDTLVAQRNPFTRTVPARIEYSYALVGPGGAWASPASIPLPAVWAFDDNYLTDGTEPTYTAYRFMSEIVIDVALTRWRGNIWERAVRSIARL